MLRTYNPKQVTIIFGVHTLEGFGPDTKVVVARDEQSWTKQVGVDGQVTRSKSNNKSGTITITLMQTSASNDFLSGIAITDELSSAGVLPVLVKDNNGTSLYSAVEAWVQKPSDASFGLEANTREWVIDVAELSIFNGGNNL